MESLSPFHPRPPHGPAQFRRRRFRRRALVLPSPNASAGVRRQSSWFRATTSHGRIYAMHASLRPSLVHFHARSNQKFTVHFHFHFLPDTPLLRFALAPWPCRRTPSSTTPTPSASGKQHAAGFLRFLLF